MRISWRVFFVSFVLGVLGHALDLAFTFTGYMRSAAFFAVNEGNKFFVNTVLGFGYVPATLFQIGWEALLIVLPMSLYAGVVWKYFDRASMRLQGIFPIVSFAFLHMFFGVQWLFVR